MRVQIGLLVAIGLLACVGCGPSYPIVEASGTIMLDGKPLGDATILTQPIGNEDKTTPGPGSGAMTDADGRFVLAFQHEDRVGAVPGEVRVKIVKNGEQKVSSDDTVTVVKSKIPWEYQEGKATYTIPAEGTTAMDFNLETKRKRR